MILTNQNMIHVSIILNGYTVYNCNSESMFNMAFSKVAITGTTKTEWYCSGETLKQYQVPVDSIINDIAVKEENWQRTRIIVPTMANI